MTIAVLLGVVLLALVVIEWRWRRTAALSQQQLAATLAELKGRYDAIIQREQEQAGSTAAQRDAYRDLASTWNERVASINESLAQIRDEAGRSISEMAGTLKPIISIFQSPQTAGVQFGEAELELLLTTHLGSGLFVRKPRHLAVGQDVVDFAITLPDCIVPIDSKFPSASYRAWAEAPTPDAAKVAWRAFRDEMLAQIAATAKYIKPDAGTTDYALLFVPSDIIYQQAFLTESVCDQENPIAKRSQSLHVFGCSPQTLMPYIGLIRLGLRNLRISEDAKAIRGHIEQLDVLYRAFGADWDVLRGHTERLWSHVQKLSTGRGSLSRLGEAIGRLAAPSSQAADSTVEPAAPPSELVNAGHDQ